MFYRGVVFVICLFMGDLLVFFDASCEISQPMILELNGPICKMACVPACTRRMAVDSLTDSGLEDSWKTSKEIFNYNL